MRRFVAEAVREWLAAQSRAGDGRPSADTRSHARTADRPGASRLRYVGRAARMARRAR